MAATVSPLELKSFATAEEAAAYWKSKAIELHRQLEETQQNFDEFQEGSRELEKELERDLNLAEQKAKDLAAENSKVIKELRLLQDKHASVKESLTAEVNSLETRVAALKAQNEEARNRIRELEQANDDLERIERAAQSSLAELEIKYNKTLERNAFLEQELEEKNAMKEELQRSKDELRDTLLELSVLKKNPSATSKQQEPEALVRTLSDTTSLDSMEGVISSNSSVVSSSNDRAKFDFSNPRDVALLSGSRILFAQDFVARLKHFEGRVSACRTMIPLLTAQ